MYCVLQFIVSLFAQEFFGRLDQHILSAYLKACDDLTDIISDEDQKSLRETVRRLHKQWKVTFSSPAESWNILFSSIVKNSLVPLIYFFQDIQAEAPSHLLRLQVEIERRLMMATLQECSAELKREDKALLTAGSERLIKEHRVKTSLNFLLVHADLVLI